VAGAPYARNHPCRTCTTRRALAERLGIPDGRVQHIVDASPSRSEDRVLRGEAAEGRLEQECVQTALKLFAGTANLLPEA
jgi:hypothetical protein